MGKISWKQKFLKIFFNEITFSERRTWCAWTASINLSCWREAIRLCNIGRCFWRGTPLKIENLFFQNISRRMGNCFLKHTYVECECKISKYFPNGPRICEWLLVEFFIESFLLELTLVFGNVDSCLARTVRKYLSCLVEKTNNYLCWQKPFCFSPSPHKEQTPLSSSKVVPMCKTLAVLRY